MSAELPINQLGCWEQLLVAGGDRPGASGPGLFLDRDGVLIEDVGYLDEPGGLALIDGAADLVAHANRSGIPVVVVTNQSGIGRRLLGWQDFARIQERLAAELASLGASLTMVLACPFHPEVEPPYRDPDHPWRKPRPGMLLAAAQRLGLDLARSWIVGDRARDLAAGRAAGLAGGVLAPSGPSGIETARSRALASRSFQVLEAASPGDCISLLPFLH